LLGLFQRCLHSLAPYEEIFRAIVFGLVIFVMAVSGVLGLTP
jgi:hypothetical protein